MSNNDLAQWVTSDVDFYELLGLTSDNPTEPEVRSGFRKRSLKYHPDKAGKDYNADRWELFTSALGVLSDPDLKAKYDGHRNAKIQRQRANELFEGKRRQMKEDLEARERGDVSSGGVKRSREDEVQGEMQQQLKKLAEEGRKRRVARASMMGESSRVETVSSPAPQKAPAAPPSNTSPKVELPKAGEAGEDEVERLERKIREAREAKEKRKAEKKARKSRVLVPAESPSVTVGGPKLSDRDTATPIKSPDIFKGLKADEKSSASPKFSFSPSIPTPKRSDFAATMARLKAAERQRMEDDIRQQESESTI